MRRCKTLLVPSHEEAASPVVATVLLVGMLASAGATYIAATGGLWAARGEGVRTDGLATFDGDGYRVALLGPDSLPLGDSFAVLDVDGVRHHVPLLDAAAQTADGVQWQVGERLCFVGPGACLLPVGEEVGGLVAHGEETAFDLPRLTPSGTWAAGSRGGAPTPLVTEPIRLPAPEAFAVDIDGGIDVGCPQQVTARVLGKQLTHGVGGPLIPVRLAYTLNGGAPYTPMFGGSAVTVGQEQVFGAPAGATIGIQMTAQRTGFLSVRHSVGSGGFVHVLADGEAVPQVPAFGREETLAAYVAPYVDVEQGVIDLPPTQAILLVEFGDSLTGSVADFQDLVLLVELRGACG